MNHLFLVGIGGFLGSVARYKLGGWVLHHTAHWKFPLSTFVVNVAGCLIAGILCGLVEKHDLFRADVRLFLFAGLLGGFTTFSAFGVETVYLIQRGDFLLALLNAVLSVGMGIGALWLAVKLVV